MRLRTVTAEPASPLTVYDPRDDAFEAAWAELDRPRLTTEDILDLYLTRVLRHPARCAS